VPGDLPLGVSTSALSILPSFIGASNLSTSLSSRLRVRFVISLSSAIGQTPLCSYNLA
jgi:hypothetical protein